ncbi:MAG: family 43 glycosylhydrolase [Chloroflexi bacterium]|nr:family 43 glycosylhydrolase [Chloroflexota bacterium]
MNRDFPDPHVIREGDTYYAYATTGSGKNLQSATSKDLVSWTLLDDPLPKLASWSGLTPLFSETPHMATWAPAAAKIDGKFVLYYTTPALDTPRPDGVPSQCIGVAVSDSPDGPFVDSSKAPIVCQADLGGSIDSTYFLDENGKQYLIWKNDGNCCGTDTRFFIQELTPNGLALRGEPTDMGVDNDTTWERFVIEAPTLIRHEGTYYLFFSGNDFASAAYAVGYATSDKVTGPYTDAEENPILKTVRNVVAGPGHQSIVTDRDGDLWMTYHAWDVKHIGYQNGGRRAMWIDELVFEGDRAVVRGPDVGPQPIP